MVEFLHPPTPTLFSFSAKASGVTDSVTYDADRGYSIARTDTGVGGIETVDFRGKAVPAGSSWTATAKVVLGPPPTGGVFYREGIAIHESATGKSLFLGINHQAGSPFLAVYFFNSLTSFGSGPYSVAICQEDLPELFRISYDGTNYTFATSYDNMVTWTTLATLAKSSFFTADKIGAFVECFQGSTFPLPTMSIPYYSDPDFVATGNNVWNSFETPDHFTALGATSVAGEWHSTEAKDAFAATGVVPYVGIWNSTEAKDAMTAAGIGPVAGVAAITEHGDSWATSSGFDILGVENVTSSSLNEFNGFNFSTNGPDRIVVFVFGSIGVGVFNLITGLSGGGIDWHVVDTAFRLDAGPGNNGFSLQIVWGYVHNKATNVGVAVSSSGGALLQLGAHFAIKGLNGNYNYPFPPAGPGLAPSVGGDNSPDAGGNIPKTPQITPYGTGPDEFNSVPYQHLVMTAGIAVQNGFNPVVHFVPPFTQIYSNDPIGAQREGTLNISAEARQFSTPWMTTDSAENSLTWGADQFYYLVMTETFVGIQTPNRWISQEAADGMRGVGFIGDSAGPIGFMNATGTPDTFHAVGFQPVSGILLGIEGRDTFSAFIRVPIVGTWTSSEAKDRMTAAGLGRGENGEWLSTESVDMFNAAGYTPVSGTFNATETTDRARFISTGVVSQRKRRTFYVT